MVFLIFFPISTCKLEINLSGSKFTGYERVDRCLDVHWDFHRQIFRQTDEQTQKNIERKLTVSAVWSSIRLTSAESQTCEEIDNSNFPVWQDHHTQNVFESYKVIGPSLSNVQRDIYFWSEKKK